MNKTLPPFDVADEHGGRPYLAFAVASEVIAWPWHSLRSLKLSSDETTLLFEYTEHSVELKGQGLSALFNLATSSRIKSVREGDSGEVSVSKIRIFGTV